MAKVVEVFWEGRSGGGGGGWWWLFFFWGGRGCEEEDAWCGGEGMRCFFIFFINLNNVGLTHSKNNCHISTPHQQKIVIPLACQLLTVNVCQTKRRYLYCTNIYSSVPELSLKILVTPTCSWHNSLNSFLHLYP